MKFPTLLVCLVAACVWQAQAGKIAVTGLDPASTKAGVFWQIDSVTGKVLNTRIWDKNETTTGRASSITYDATKKEFVSMNWNGQAGLLQILDKDTFASKAAVRSNLPWVNDLVYDTVQKQILGNFCDGWYEPLTLQYITCNSTGVYRVGSAITNDYWPSFGMGYYPNMTTFDSINRQYYVLVGDFNLGDYRKITIGNLNVNPGQFSSWNINTGTYIVQHLMWNAVDNKLYAIATEKRYTNPKIMMWDSATHVFVDTGLAAMGSQYMYGPAIVDERGYIMWFVRKTATDANSSDENAVRNYELWELSPSRSTQRVVASYTDTSQILLRAAYAA
jgi:hypothetical protein